MIKKMSNIWIFSIFDELIAINEGKKVKFKEFQFLEFLKPSRVNIFKFEVSYQLNNFIDPNAFHQLSFGDQKNIFQWLSPLSDIYFFFFFGFSSVTIEKSNSNFQMISYNICIANFVF